ncbi:MAG: S41 family peptidase [Bacteroidetes bacterium]|nr:S41 family peptidase [Bacteroidota bacterium]
MQKIKSFYQSARGKFIITITGISSIFVLTSAVTSADLFEIGKNIDIFTSVYKELNTYYVDDVDPNKLMRTGIDAMLESLDPYTNYISEAELEGYKFQITGNYGGIGASIRTIDGQSTVVECFEGFAAEKSGLIPGDIILEIDGKKLSDVNQDGISDLLRGSPGTTLTLKVNRPLDNKTFDLAIVREDIDVHNVPYYGFVEDGIGYIILNQFTEDAGLNIGNAVKELKKLNPAMNGIILDLRGNPGGLLREAVNVSNVFIDKGEEVCSTLGKVKEWDKTFNTLNGAIDSKINLVVLTNSSSASASEIVAGTIQDYDRGVILGEKSFGKGLVQTTRDISFNTKLKLTTAKYYIPSGRCIQALDYSHRNEDGSVGKLPDSLKTAFKTKNGRTVYDGGGIDPDVKVERESYRDITISLIRKNHIFNYATIYHHDHPEITNAKSFTLTDKEYETFVEWLKGKEYDYTTATEQDLEYLEASAKEDAYYDALKDDFTSLKSKITHDKEKDLYKFKTEIMAELNAEIVFRYYNEDGRIEANFDQDKEIIEAVKLLKDENQYKSLLQPK